MTEKNQKVREAYPFSCRELMDSIGFSADSRSREDKISVSRSESRDPETTESGSDGPDLGCQMCSGAPSAKIHNQQKARRLILENGQDTQEGTVSGDGADCSLCHLRNVKEQGKVYMHICPIDHRLRK